MKTFLCHSLTNGTIDQSVDLALFRKCPKADGEGVTKHFRKLKRFCFISHRNEFCNILQKLIHCWALKFCTVKTKGGGEGPFLCPEQHCFKEICQLASWVGKLQNWWMKSVEGQCDARELKIVTKYQRSFFLLRSAVTRWAYVAHAT